MVTGPTVDSMDPATATATADLVPTAMAAISRYIDRMTDTADFENEIAYLRETPVEQILGNHIFVLLQLVAVHLAATPPKLSDAQLVIDTLSAIIETGGDRLGEHVGLYRTALAEVQQAYVRAATTPPADATPA